MNKGYTAAELAKMLNAELIGPENAQVYNQIVSDSRTLFVSKRSFFVALNGKNFDAYRFVPELYQQGIRLFVVERADFVAQCREAQFIVVNNTLEALQKLAAAHRLSYSFPVLGITGSNGKTVVKEWLSQLLASKYRIVKSPGSYNSQVGVPLSVWQMSDGDELGIFEAGISEPGEMESLHQIIKPSIGIFTHLGIAHQQSFSNLHAKAAEKLKLFVGADILIYPADEEILNNAVQEWHSKGNGRTHLLSYGRSAGNYVQILDERIAGGQSFIAITHQAENLEIAIPMADEASIQNALSCICLLLYLKWSVSEIEQGLAKLNSLPQRMELLKGKNNCLIINDSYSNDLGSLKIALDLLNHQQEYKTKCLVLSDILESGENSRHLYAAVNEYLITYGIEKLFAVGSAISSAKNEFDIPAVFFSDTKTCLEYLSKANLSNTAILIKGARLFAFEKIVQHLQMQEHQTRLEVDLNAMVHNLNYYRSILPRSCKIMAMVKAFSYGSGSAEVAQLLQYHKVEYLAVAYADEGLELRNKGISMPIMVMNPELHSLQSIINNRLEPEIYSLEILQAFQQTLDANNYKGKFPIHIKIDTGMHRLGFEKQHIKALCSFLQENNRFRIESIFSHLAASDDPAHDAFSNHQIKEFTTLADKIEACIKYKTIRHILNSSGASRFANSKPQMVRLGIGLYGVSPHSWEKEKLKPVSCLKSTISQIHYLKKGETVGYLRKGVLEKDSKIATVAIGYADGYDRRLGNGKAAMIVNNKPAKTIGSICMDMSMIDVSEIQCKVGDEVIVIGESFDIYEISNAAQTIPYEILTGISPRVKRVYIQE